MGFGLLGSVAGRFSRIAGTSLGYYGLGWSVFSTVVARGGEVEFGKNTVVDIGFTTRPPSEKTELKHDGTQAPAK